MKTQKPLLYLVSLLLVSSIASTARAADNLFTQHTIMDVFGPRTLLISDGVNVFSIITSDGCSFTKEDESKTLTLPETAPKQDKRYRDSVSIAKGFRILYAGQECTVEHFSEYIYHTPLTRATALGNDLMNELVQVQIQSNIYNVDLSKNGQYTSIPVGTSMYLESAGYVPGVSDRMFLFNDSTDSIEYRDSYTVHSVEFVLYDKNTKYPRRMGFWSAGSSNGEDIRKEFLTFTNRTRQIVSTRKWKLVNSNGQTASLPKERLRTNQRLKIKIGNGEDHRVNKLVKKIYLGRNNSFINNTIDWVKVVDENNRTVLTYYN